MHKISLKDWVVLLTIVPTTLIGLGIGGYFSYNRYVELDEYLTLRAKSIAEPIAIVGVEPIIEKNRDILRRLIGTAHRNHSDIVKNITIFTADNQIFVTSAYHGDTGLLRLKPEQLIPQQTMVEVVPNYLIFRTPIYDDIRQQSPNLVYENALGYIAIQIDRNKVQFRQQSQIVIALGIVVFGSLISAIFAFRLIKNVTRPVTSMVQAVDRIREGKLESRVSGQLVGELNFLKNGINAMAQSLGDYHDEMQRSVDQATVDLRESLEQFEIQNVELDIAKRKAQEANKVKSEFLANMSHELRTPLNGVIGFTRQVLKTPLGDTQRDYLQTIERSANNLLAIINDILDFSKLDAGKMVIESIPFTLRESLEESLTLLAPSAHKKNIELSLRIAPQVPDSLIGDAMRIKQILINLANNAIKFTDKGAVCIDVDIEHQQDNKASFKVTVTDTGIGMNSEQQKTIFEAFGQADKSVTRLYGGTGLGLVISQRLAQEMQGDIGFISEEREGSTFWFTFKCEINPVILAHALPVEALASKSILYFEPHTHSRIATSDILTSWHMQVMPIGTLDELTTELEQNQHYDFALISHDVTPAALPELKALIALLQKRTNTIHLAVNSNSPSLHEVLIGNGATSCLSKPITPSRLAKSLMPQHHENTTQVPIVGEQKLPIKVLAVDDNDANLKLIHALLAEQVQEIHTACNGQEAVNLCQSEKFALIFMDIQMPVMDGITALKTIKAQTFNDETPIIAVTAHALSGEKEKLMVEGFSSYMTKPIDESMLKHTIYEYCDLTLLSPKTETTAHAEIKSPTVIDAASFTLPIQTNAIDWQLALTRTGNKVDLAKDMLSGLVNSLPETKSLINEAIVCQDIEQVNTLIHKLNGACCYTGVPALGKITHQIETMLKQGQLLDQLEPEFFEFFEHIDNVLDEAPKVLEEVEELSSQS
ncbi:two-component sensor histidine kinase BarA [Thalassotalea euphylliae]|uniref:histidine kinase n=1 Tax=Thalassotalea euphylliae TaxID=1655234 RepID=A0A3E0U1U8_9GAMM|nr:two-component sensor histidine kinase BarA [Thalassotalea euphylliae]REL30543.1 two-component sensor histidine kinase BarA [Thalassotalea euphylliae]